MQDVDQNEEDAKRRDHGTANAQDSADVAADVAVFLGRADRQRALAARFRPGAEVRPARLVTRAGGVLPGSAFLGHDLGFELGGVSQLGFRKALGGPARRSGLLSDGRVSV